MLRDNPFAKIMKRSVASRSCRRACQDRPTTSDTLVAFAARPAQWQAMRRHNSPFAAALVKHITETGLDLRIAFGRSARRRAQEHRQPPEPFLYGSLGGDTMSLVPSVAKPVDAEAGVRVDYELAAQIAPRKPGILPREPPNGSLSGLARAQNNKLATAQQSRAMGDDVRPDAGEQTPRRPPNLRKQPDGQSRPDCGRQEATTG